MAPDMSVLHARPQDTNTLPLPSFSKAFPYFHKDIDALLNDIDPFTVNATTGFLPTQHPVKNLPESFQLLQRIVENMPVIKEDGTPGLIATYELGPLIDSGDKLPDLTDEIDKLVVPETGKLDLHIITALFRDYSFLASAYLLEPCWENKNKFDSASTTPNHNDTPAKNLSKSGCPHTVTPEYGFGRSVLPAPIARPLVKLAEILNIPPFMSYAASYALYNYHLVDPTLGADIYSNLRLIRSFERGADPTSSEAGFILTHIHMVALTGPLISSVISTLEFIESLQTTPTPQPIPSPDSLHPLKTSLTTLLTTMTQIEANMEKMWTHSLPKDYPTYRTFIFGITSQPLFPDGVIYESCFNDLPQYYRGESGANDSIIPLLDNLCQIAMPRTPLTDILREFRGYRPESQRALLVWVESKATELSTREVLGNGADLEVAVLYLRVLDHVRSFRWRHWMFAREYIIKRSKYPVATGGSPIVTWLPNQLGAVLGVMEGLVKGSGLGEVVGWNGGGNRSESDSKSSGGSMSGRGGLSVTDVKIVRGIMEVVEEQKVKLDKEVRKYCEERGV